MNYSFIYDIKYRRRSEGLSFIEIILVVVVLGILTGFAVPAYQEWVKEARLAKSKSDLSTIAELVSKYEIEQNMEGKLPPVRLRSLNELKGKYIADPERLKDPWGRAYRVLPEKGFKSIEELLPGSKDRYKVFMEDVPANQSTGEHPKIIYSVGPNGIDDKGKIDDIKKECRKFRYLSGINTAPAQSGTVSSQPAPATTTVEIH